jgi:hypothetical protein
MRRFDVELRIRELVLQVFGTCKSLLFYTSFSVPIRYTSRL